MKAFALFLDDKVRDVAVRATVRDIEDGVYLGVRNTSAAVPKDLRRYKAKFLKDGACTITRTGMEGDVELKKFDAFPVSMETNATPLSFAPRVNC